MKKINIVVAGATGYIGLEVIKLLVKHPYVKIKYLCAQSSIGLKISKFEANTLVAVAAKLGTVRLIDNILIK